MLIPPSPLLESGQYIRLKACIYDDRDQEGPYPKDIFNIRREYGKVNRN